MQGARARSSQSETIRSFRKLRAPTEAARRVVSVTQPSLIRRKAIHQRLGGPFPASLFRLIPPPLRLLQLKKKIFFSFLSPTGQLSSPSRKTHLSSPEGWISRTHYSRSSIARTRLSGLCYLRLCDFFFSILLSVPILSTSIISSIKFMIDETDFFHLPMSSAKYTQFAATRGAKWTGAFVLSEKLWIMVLLVRLNNKLNCS